MSDGTSALRAQKQTFCDGVGARIYLGLSIVVNPQGATCSDTVQADSR
jgi:hypothetical protein